MQDDKMISNTWPEGWEDAYKSLDFLPEDARESFLAAFIDFTVSM